MNANKHYSTTLSMCDYQTFRSFNSKNKRIDLKIYQHKIDKLIYVVMHTRSNICFAFERLNCNEFKIQLCAKDIALESNISFCEDKRA